MNSQILEQLEILENRIESLKWLAVTPSSFRKPTAGKTPSIIRKTCGMVGKDAAKGIHYENKSRGEWETRLKEIS